MLLLTLLVACPQEQSSGDKGTDTAVDVGPDTDGDGVPDSADCDPNDPFVYPGASELPYNEVDEDCDGVALMDVDGDGHVGVRGGGDDCDDSNPTINPSHIEVCYDNLDNNCDGWEGGTDCDGDGFPLGADCWDDEEDTTFSNPGGLRPVDVYPGAPDTWYDGTDADCAINDDFDQDADGESASAHGGTDCDDVDARVGTEMPELWNDFDDDCDGEVDALEVSSAYMRVSGSSGDGEADFGTAVAFIPDLDGDGKDDLVVGMGASDEYLGGVWILPTETGILTPATEALGFLSGTGGTGTSMAHTRVTGADTLAVGSPWGETTGAVDFYDLGNIADGAAVARVEQAGAGGSVVALSDGRLLVGCTYGASSLAVSTWSSVSGTVDLGDAPFAVTASNLACTTSQSLGDLDGDGMDEVFLAAYDEAGINYAYLADGSVQAVGGRVPTSSLEYMGNPDIALRYGTLGDLDGNGYDDAIISHTTTDAASTGDGRIWIIDGASFSASWSTSARATISGGTSGASIRPGTLGDLDGDGAPELLVGSTGQAQLGFVTVADLLTGGDHIPEVGVPTFSDPTGASLFGDAAWAHDFDHDGDDDILARAGRTPGGLYLFLRE